jgi:hypothetical protein
MFRTTFLFVLIMSAASTFACDADVLRYHYRKAPASKPAAAPTTPLPKVTGALRKPLAPSASLTASTKLGPR